MCITDDLFQHLVEIHIYTVLPLPELSNSATFYTFGARSANCKVNVELNNAEQYFTLQKNKTLENISKQEQMMTEI